MILNTLSIFLVRILVPILSFGSNLILLWYLGLDRFAVLASLLQGSLLATVLLKFGADDAILYGNIESLSDSRRLQPEVLLGIFGLLPLVVLALVVTRGSSFLTNGLQVLILGFLNAQLCIAAMRLQVRGHVWIGNLVLSIAAPAAIIIGTSILSIWWPTLTKSGDSITFCFSIGFGFVFCLIILSLLQQEITCGKHDISALSPRVSALAGAPPITRSLWLLQIIDVLLLSGDLILLGLFNKLENLEHYIAASRLAVASSFVLLAIEQYLATIQRDGRQFRFPYWMVFTGMLTMIPFYLLLLSFLGIKSNVHYDLDALVIFMSIAAGQSLFLCSKVRWAGQLGVATLHTSILKILVMAAVTTCGLCWLALDLNITASMRAACFGALALLTRWALYLRWEVALSEAMANSQKCK